MVPTSVPVVEFDLKDINSAIKEYLLARGMYTIGEFCPNYDADEFCGGQIDVKKIEKSSNYANNSDSDSDSDNK